MNHDQQPRHFARTLHQRLDIDFALQAAGLGVWELDRATNEVFWDDRCRELFGLSTDNRLSYSEVITHIHPDDITRASAAVEAACTPGSNGLYDETLRVSGVDDGILRWVRFHGRAYFNESGEVYRFGGVAQDVSESVLAQQQVVEKSQTLAESEARFRGIVDQLPGAVLVVRGDDFIVDQINPPMMELIGRGADVIGQPFLSFMPELEGEFAWQQVRRAYFEGIEYVGKEIMVTHSRGDKFSDYFYNLSYRPLWEGGKITGVIQAATDISEQVIARKKLEQTEEKLRGVIAAAPAGIGLFIGRDLVIESANETFIKIVGKGPGVEGLPLREAMPELLSEGQPFLKILDDVFTTGVPFVSPASLVKIVQDGVLNSNYYNISYTPLRNTSGEIYGILDIAIDVTSQILSQRALEEKESTLRGAIEIADMGIWELNMKTGITVYTERLRQLFEFEEDFIDWEHLYNPIHEDDRERLKMAVQKASDPEIGFLDEEYTVVTQQTGRQRIVRAQAKMYFDKEGNPDKLVGSMRDLTQERKIQWDLEQLVHQRTQELEAANEELASINEELAAKNEELEAGNDEYMAINERMEEVNNSLLRSNSNLETFAYVASHDLQEPLRKIQQFSSLLLARYGGSIGDGYAYVERMQAAASRMSALIEDLLNFSRISTHHEIHDTIPLQDVVSLALTTLELTIQETNAKIEIGALPSVIGDASQLTQLFQNLLSNALKFSRVDGSGNAATPVIQIKNNTLNVSELPAHVRPARSAMMYHCISVTDNGVGFDEKYLDRIFQLFQRLHGRTEFAGTGIGLAISERVVQNHGGAITANSEPGMGATFRVYLPV
ncbi:PAS domain-containing sensor histidine kinase [Dyadobacter luticola]|uniref:histidine kinase n=1 Tax=Dyadobacter luticola TaxID=1979387 RepID=A0A5R9L6B7_9BACT|nr:PAS domain S-box protein [Dyadobacter luticola]TLV03961.1 PAS domain S-box protein [Dyadobacter luticola]